MEKHLLPPHFARPPTLLEDRECNRGNQLKQSLDGWEVVRLTGKDVNHLKDKASSAHTHQA